MTRTKKRLLLCRVLIFCCLAFIWGNSLLPGSASQAISDGWKAFFGLSLSAGVLPSGRGLIRKLAHFTEFAALGWLLGWHGAMEGKKPRLAAWLGIAAACLDETIQLFTPNRGPSLADVTLDSFGVLAGIGVLHLGHTLFKTLHRNHFGGQNT